MGNVVFILKNMSTNQTEAARQIVAVVLLFLVLFQCQNKFNLRFIDMGID